MILSDFWALIDGLLAGATAMFTALDAAILIDSPRVSLLNIMLGFLLLDLIVYYVNKLRKPAGEQVEN
jgi:hypothetical protein